MVFSSVPPPAPVGKPEEHHRERWSRAAAPSRWAWREVDGRPGGGAERRFPQTRRGETIERAGQRVMRVRRWRDGLPPTSQLEARAGVRRGGGQGRPPGARGGKGFVCGFHAQVLWNSASNAEPPRRSLLSVLRPACQAQSTVEGAGETY